MNGLRPWHIIVFVIVLVLLFGAKRLPDAARSLGRSLRIIKAETKGLIDEDNDVAEKAEPQYSRQPIQGEVHQPGYQQAPPPGYQPAPGYQQAPPAPGYQQAPPAPGYQPAPPPQGYQQPPAQPYVDPVQRTNDR